MVFFLINGAFVYILGFKNLGSNQSKIRGGNGNLVIYRRRRPIYYLSNKQSNQKLPGHSNYRHRQWGCSLGGNPPKNPPPMPRNRFPFPKFPVWMAPSRFPGPRVRQTWRFSSSARSPLPPIGSRWPVTARFPTIWSRAGGRFCPQVDLMRRSFG